MIEVDGIKSLYKVVQSLDREAARGMVTAGMKAAQVVADRAKIEAPRQTGALARSIRPARKQGGAAVRAGGTASVAYAKPVHFGYRTLPYKGNRFMFRAADASVDEAAALYLADVERIWNEVMG